MAQPDESGPIDRHRKIRELFDRALERNESQRLSFLHTACGGDAGLLQDVIRLLAAHTESGSFLGEVKNKAPEKIGRYEVTGELGRGAMGIVYEAKDPLIGRTVAVKTINANSFSQPDEARFLQQQLLKEATAAGQLSHPNIVTIHDMGIEGEMAFIAMEKMEGASIHELLAPGEKLEPAKAIAILRQCAAALDYAHLNGIVHRDIKPANIMLHKGGQVKITDFGIAKNTLSPQKTGFGIALGTPSYMSPEQIRGEISDGRSDEFSLAVVAYELLTGAKPFRAENLPELLWNIRDGIRPSAYAANPQLPPTIDAVLHKALARLPKDRYQTCAELVSGLESVLLPKSGDAGIAGKKSRAPSLVLAILAGVIAVVAAGAGAYKFFFPHPVPPEGQKTVSAPPVKKVPAPVVLLFSADPGSPGKPASLRWDVRNADEIFIDPDVGSVESNGSFDLKTSTSKAYQLNAHGPGGNVTANVELQEKPSAFAKPIEIQSFEAVPPVVKKDGKFELRWRVQGDFEELSIDHGIGVVKGGVYQTTAKETTIYTLTARSQIRTVTQQVTIRVDLPSQPAPSPNVSEAAPDGAKLFESAVALRNAGQPAEAVPLFRRAAELGHAPAMLELGKMLLAGHDVPQDYTQALSWFRKAAEAGNPSAMVFVGVMTAKGIGTAKDEAQAAAWYRRGANAGYPAAMDGLGVMYANGQGVQKDPAEAARWYQKAVDHGSAPGMTHLAAAYESGAGVTRSLKDAIHWYQMASDKGDRDATARLRQLTAVAVTPPSTTPPPAANPPAVITPPGNASPGNAPPPVGRPSGPVAGGTNVPGNQSWLDTGVTLKAGDTVKIAATGRILVSVNGKPVMMTPLGLDAPNCNGAPGLYGRDAAFPAPLAPCWSLIGRIGSTGKIFAVGTLRIISSPVAGPLLLGVNDSAPAGNSGFWNVSLSVIPGTGVPGAGVPSAESTPPAQVSTVRLTGMQPGTINAKKSQKYTITGAGLTAKTVVSLDNLRVYIGTKSGVADYYPAEVAKDGSWIKIYIGPLPLNLSKVRIIARASGSAAASLEVPVKR